MKRYEEITVEATGAARYKHTHARTRVSDGEVESYVVSRRWFCFPRTLGVSSRYGNITTGMMTVYVVASSRVTSRTETASVHAMHG